MLSNISYATFSDKNMRVTPSGLKLIKNFMGIIMKEV